MNPRFCRCEILCIGETVLKHKFRGMLKKEDVRATERDKVKLYECFRPGELYYNCDFLIYLYSSLASCIAQCPYECVMSRFIGHFYWR